MKLGVAVSTLDSLKIEEQFFPDVKRFRVSGYASGDGKIEYRNTIVSFNFLGQKIKLVGELTYANRANANLKIPGGVAGAIRHTKQTGELVGGSDHTQKGRDILGKLIKVRKRINNSHGMSDSERSSLLNTVNRHIDDLTDALK